MIHNKFTDILQTCKRSKIAYHDSSFIKRVYKGSIFYDGCHKQKNDAQGFLQFDKNKIYVTYRGTMNFMDTKDVIDIRHEKFISPNIKVHKGFHSQFFSIEEDITRDIKDIVTSYKVDEIIFGGHSLAGSIALISSPYYGHLFNKKYKISTYTFGSVSVGNKEFINWFLKYVDSHYRIEHKDDIVPMIPIHKTFQHVPNGITICNNGSVKYHCDTSSMSYTKLLSKLLVNKPTWEQLFNDHSCDTYHKTLMVSHKLHNDFWNMID